MRCSKEFKALKVGGIAQQITPVSTPLGMNEYSFLKLYIICAGFLLSLRETTIPGNFVRPLFVCICTVPVCMYV